MTSTCKEHHLSEMSQEFLELSTELFGLLVADYTRERLMALSESMQEDLIWHVLHYVYSDEIMTTGNLDVDIKLTEIVGKLPFFSVVALRNMKGLILKEVAAQLLLGMTIRLVDHWTGC